LALETKIQEHEKKDVYVDKARRATVGLRTAISSIPGGLVNDSQARLGDGGDSSAKPSGGVKPRTKTTTTNTNTTTNTSTKIILIN